MDPAKTPSRRRRVPPPRAGWREWIQLPELGVPAIKAKLDTGARTSAIHAFQIEQYRAGGKDRVRFQIHPIQRSHAGVVAASARLIDERLIRSSSGHTKRRLVIETTMVLGEERWDIELTLASRDEMGFRLLLGRQALRHRVVVDSGRSYVLSKVLRKASRSRRPKR